MSIALVTGASAGIGQELAFCFAKDKHDLVLVARRREKLDSLASELAEQHGVTAHVVAADLSEPDAGARIHEQVEALGLEIEFLVNNAGLGSNGRFVELDEARELAMIQVNVTALVQLTHRFLPAMIARKSGRILNIASVAGMQPGPYMATYFATKAFVISFSEAIDFEVRQSGVTVTAHCPGATESEFAALAGNDKTRLFKQGKVATSREVAEHAYRAMLRGRPLAIHGATNRILAFFGRLAPRAVTRAAAAKFNEADA